MDFSSSAPGKIILSGDHAVVYGLPGIAVPAKQKIGVRYEQGDEPLAIDWPLASAEWIAYTKKIAGYCKTSTGTVRIGTDLPLGRGMGSSTALVIALSRCLLGDDCEAQALAIEDTVNPGHSGLDFTVIWRNQPVLYRKGTSPQPFTIDLGWMRNALLIDTGRPDQTTAELVAWVRSREAECAATLTSIGRCTERLAKGESPMTVFPDHHRAQVALGVVPEPVQKLITAIEQAGSAAKVLGAGARTGGGGMVLAIGSKQKLNTALKNHPFTILN